MEPLTEDLDRRMPKSFANFKSQLVTSKYSRHAGRMRRIDARFERKISINKLDTKHIFVLFIGTDISSLRTYLRTICFFFCFSGTCFIELANKPKFPKLLFYRRKRYCAVLVVQQGGSQHISS